jgi:hypothetical protein
MAQQQLRIGHVAAIVDDILRYRRGGDIVLEEQAIRTYEEILGCGVEHSRSCSVREQLADFARMVASEVRS